MKGEKAFPHCDRYQRNTGLDLVAADTENVPEISKIKSNNEQHSVSKKWRIEDLLKNLVGKKPSPLLTVHKKKTLSDQDLTEEEALVESSARVTVSDIHSTNPLRRSQMAFKSTTSLNALSTSGVRQNLWSVIPLLNRKEESCSMQALRGRGIFHFIDSHYCFCDNPRLISVSKKQSKSIHNLLEPMKPLNRLRNSKSCYIANSCSRCSSLLSLSALGSNSSLAFLNRGTSSNPRSFLASVDYEKVHQYMDNSSHHLIDETAIEFEMKAKQKSRCSKSYTFDEMTCKLCLSDCTEDQITRIKSCGCFFCIEVCYLCSSDDDFYTIL